MKLLELLIKELPKRGGWPEAIEGVDLPLAGNDLVTSWRFNAVLGYFVACTYGEEMVTRDQYEAAITSSQQPVWTGEGLPPVGSLVDVQMYRGCGGECDLEWRSEKVLGHDGDVIIVASGCRAGDYDGIKPHSYRPIRTEAERRREGAIAAMRQALGHASGLIEISNIYSAIAAGKIPGIRLTDD
jgi:hypothetical protein